jgi:D-arabinose 1-dehydrogenase-like Zn-dependent alcohol dehydrogenase
MRAIQFLRIGEVAHTEVPKPTIGAGQFLVRVTAAGVCQTDIHVRRSAVRMIMLCLHWKAGEEGDGGMGQMPPLARLSRVTALIPQGSGG